MIVYWCNVDIHNQQYSMTGLRRLPPYPIKRILNNKYDVRESNTNHETYFRCPAHTDHLKNLFAVPAAFDCDLIIDKQPNQPEFATSTFFKNNNDFDKAFLIRSIKNRLFSINLGSLFVTESDDILMSQMPAYLESNGFVDNTVIIPGTFNVGRWPRVLECAFHLKEDKMFVKEGDPLYYLKFYTDEKIVFKEFLYTQKMRDYVTHLLSSRNYKTKRVTKLDFFYNMIGRKQGFKQRMLEEAKANVIGD
jgi:hypothetical protein